MKPIQMVLASLLASAVLTGSALAQQVGIVDMQEVTQKYTKAQELAIKVKNREDDLQKLRDSLLGKLKAGDKMTPVEKKNLEDKLNTEFATKFQEYRDWTVTQEQSLKSDFDDALKQVAQNQKLDLIIAKQTVLMGGRDITTDVIDALNKSTAAPAK